MRRGAGGGGGRYRSWIGCHSSGVVRAWRAEVTNSATGRSSPGDPGGNVTTVLRPSAAPFGYGRRTPLPHPLPVSSICFGLTSVMGASTILQAPISPSRTMRAATGSV